MLIEHHSETPAAASAEPRAQRSKLLLRSAIATVILLAAIAAACIVMVPAGSADVITRFGAPVRVVTRPGLAWKLPPPFESAIPIDLRLRTTSTGVLDVGTRNGLRLLVQAYAAWRVPDDPSSLLRFLRSARNQPNEAAQQLRTFLMAGLQIVSTNFSLSDLVNTDPQKVRLDSFESQLRQQVAPRTLRVYGIDIAQVGVERLTLPDQTLAATVARMKAERETVAAQVMAEGLAHAAPFRVLVDGPSGAGASGLSALEPPIDPKLRASVLAPKPVTELGAAGNGQQ